MSPPALHLSSSTVPAGGTLIATGDCMGMTRNVVPHIYVFTVKGQAPEVRYDDFIYGAMEPDATFEIRINLAPGAPPGQYAATAVCVLDGDQSFSGDEIRFEVTPGDPATASSSTLVVTPHTAVPAPASAVPIEVRPTYTG